MKRYVTTREGAKAVGDIIAAHPLPINDHGGSYGFCVEILETRTLPQNNALYKFFELLAAALNDKHLYIQMDFLGKHIEVEWSKDEVKKRIWKPVMQAKTGKTSTTKLERAEVGAIYDTLNLFFIEKYDLFCPFPEDKDKP
jgi:hypothetical protein